MIFAPRVSRSLTKYVFTGDWIGKEGQEFPYQKWKDGKITNLLITGLPEGVILKKPSSYSKVTMEAIVRHEAQIRFGNLNS